MDSLCLDSCQRCVLGQLFGDYRRVSFRNDLTFDISYSKDTSNAFLTSPMQVQMAQHGFTLTGSNNYLGNIWQDLTDEWKKQILERREKKVETWRDRPSLL